MRIASLLASGTELVCELGAGDELVARVELLAAVLRPDRFSLRDLDPVPERILRVAPLHAG